MSRQSSMNPKSLRGFHANTHSSDTFIQTETFCSNKIRTAKYNM